jgi:hypothetical protein
MCRWDMLIRVVSRVGVWEGLCDGSIMGLMSEVMPVWVRVWGVNVWLMTTCMMSTCVPCQCEPSTFGRGVYFSTMRW